MGQLFSNNGKTTLASPVNTVTTSIVVVDASKFPVTTGGNTFKATLENLNRTAVEIVEVTAVVGNTLTVVRAQEGTVASAFDAGSFVEGRLTAGWLNDTGTKLGTIETGAQVNTVTSVAGKTGVVTLVKGDVGLSNVDNTSDANKPISTATQTALDTKLASASYTASDVLSKIKSVDGADSGLDADLLDGMDSTVFSRRLGSLSSTTIDFNTLISHGTYHQPMKDGTVTYTNHPTGLTNTSRFTLTINNASGDDLVQIISVQDGGGGGRMWKRHRQDSTWFPWIEIWTSATGGSDSGLDADLLDGKQGSWYAPLASPAFTGTPTAPTAAEGTNTTQLATTAFVLGNTENSLTSTSTTKALSAAMGNVLYNKTFDPSVKPTLSSDFANDKHEVYENNRFVSKTVETAWSVTRSTTGTYVDPTGIIRTAALNVPRYTFENGVPKGLLVEEARTNLLSYSEDFSNTVWTKRAGSAIESNVITAPDNTLTADKHYNTDTNTNTTYITRNAFTSDNTVYCASMFVKRGSQSSCVITMYSKLSTNDRTIINFNFDTETFVITNVGDVTGSQGGFEKCGNGWFRVWLSANMLSGTSGSGVRFAPSNWGTPTAISSEYGYIWGAQLEVGSTPSSYIPTTTAQVTRAADSVVRTLAAEFNPSEFTVFYDGGLGTGSYPSIFSIRNESDTDSVQVRRNAATNANLSTNYILLVVINDVVTSVAVGNTLKKAAVTYKDGVTKLYVDGQYKTQIEGVLNSNLFTELVTSPKESVSSIKVYPSALSDAECVALTAL